MVVAGDSNSRDCTIDLDHIGHVEFIDEDEKSLFHEISMNIAELHFQLQLEHERVLTRLKKEGETKNGATNGVRLHPSPGDTKHGATNGMRLHPSPRIYPEKFIKHPLPPSPPPLLRDADEAVPVETEHTNARTDVHQSQKTKFCETLENEVEKEVKFLGPFPYDLDVTSNGQRVSGSIDSASDRISCESSSHSTWEVEGSGKGVARVGRLAALQSRNVYSDIILEAALEYDDDDDEDDYVRPTTYTAASRKVRQSTRQSFHSNASARTWGSELNKANSRRRGAIWIRNSQQLEDDKRRLAALAVGQEDEDVELEIEYEQPSTLKNRIKLIVRSMQFEMVFAAVIISNSFFMGVQTEYTVRYPLDDPPAAFYALQFLYGIVFTIELLLRLCAEDLSSFFCGDQCHWNMLDVFIVTTSLFEMVTDILYLTSKSTSSDGLGGLSNLRIVRIIRITRLIRVFRVARIVRFIRALRTLVYSILCTLKSVIWAILLLLILVYVTGMVFAQAASDYISGGNTKDMNLIQKYWGTLPRSMFTLYKSVSGGVSWHDVVEPLSAIHGFWVAIFIGFVSFTFFAVLNVITGVFCQSAIESAQHDQDMQVQTVLQNKSMYTKWFKGLFQAIDADESEYITFPEFERHFKDDKVRAYFASLEIDPSDAWELFKLLDTNETGIIDAKEFIMGCMRLRGQAKAMHIAQLSFENKAIRKKLTHHIETVEAQLHHIIESLSVDRRSLSIARTKTDQSDATSHLGPGQSWYDFQLARRSVATTSASQAKLFRE